MSVNQYNILGNLGADPELRYTNNGTAVCNLRVAVDAGFGDNKSTTWVKCTVWGKRAEVVEKHFRKGNKIFCTGEIRTDSYEKEGVTIYTWELNVEDFSFVDSKGSQPSAGPEADFDQSFDDDDIPF